MRTRLLIVLGTALLLWTCGGQETKDPTKAEAGKVTAHSGGLHGYIGYSATAPPARSEYSAGMGFYSAVWPLIDQPLADFQIGLAGSWITPDNSDNKDTAARSGGHAGPAVARARARRGPAYSKPWKAGWATGRATTSATARRSSA